MAAVVGIGASLSEAGDSSLLLLVSSVSCFLPDLSGGDFVLVVDMNLWCAGRMKRIEVEGSELCRRRGASLSFRCSLLVHDGVQKLRAGRSESSRDWLLKTDGAAILQDFAVGVANTPMRCLEAETTKRLESMILLTARTNSLYRFRKVWE
jgi:hypothetical protein